MNQDYLSKKKNENESRLEIVILNKILFSFGYSTLQDGRIDYGEFAAMMRKGDGGVGRSRTMRSNLNFNLADAFGVKDSTLDTNQKQSSV
jgi:hypothetical protein